MEKVLSSFELPVGNNCYGALSTQKIMSIWMISDLETCLIPHQLPNLCTNLQIKSIPLYLQDLFLMFNIFSFEGKLSPKLNNDKFNVYLKRI